MIAVSHELPDGWVWTTMGEVFVVESGGTPSTKNPANFAGPIPWVTPADLSELEGKFISRGSRNITKEGLESSSAKLLPKGTVIFSSRAPIGYVAIAQNEISTNQGCKNFIIPKGIFNEYVYYYLKGNADLAESYASGTTFLELSIKRAAMIPFPLPPLSEQRRIVAKIEELFTQLDAGISNLKKAQSQLKRYRQSVLKAAVEGKLTRKWREAHPGVEPASILLERILKERQAKWEEEELAKLIVKGQRPKNDRWKHKYEKPDAAYAQGLPKLPEEWTWATPDQLAATKKYSLAIGPFGSNLKVSDYRETGVPLVFVRNIRSGIFGGADTHYVTMEKADELNAHKIIGGDILITKMGEPPGDACLYPDSRPTAIITADCIKWTLSNILPESRFFVHVMNSHIMKSQILRITQGVAQKKISLARFKSVAIPLPPLHEQHEIVSEIERRFSVADQTEATLEANLKRATGLRQSTLKKAFRGTLVPQDPKDEPASKLLRRVKEEMAKNKRKEKPIKREKKGDESMDRTRHSLYDVLVEAKIKLTPEELFIRSSFTLDTIDEFYQELRSEVVIPSPRIEEIRPNSKEVYLKVRGK